MNQQLSEAGKNALKAVKALPPAEQAIIVLALAAKIAQKVSTAGSEQIGKSSSEIEQGIKTASHGFKQVTAAIEVKITRPTGEEVTILLSEGARGKLYRELADYGKNELKGATLLTREDFEAVVYSLFEAIKGLKVVKGALQTKDAALKQAYNIVKDGVRAADGFWWGKFDLDSGGAVVGQRVHVHDGGWGDSFRDDCAAFASPPAETTSPAVAELKLVDGHQAVVGKITVNGQQLLLRRSINFRVISAS
jgi:hypothetical protein